MTDPIEAAKLAILAWMESDEAMALVHLSNDSEFDDAISAGQARAAIAELRERHEAFVRAAKDDAIAAEGYLSLDGRMRNWAAFMAAQRIIALCDAELGKEWK